MSPALPAIAVRLADEGIPLRAIARAVQVPSTEVYETLLEAKMTGQLLELPRDDWPPGCPRDQRALQLSRMMAENKPALTIAVQSLFHLTPTQARLVLLMVQHELVPRERVGISGNCFNVHLVTVRKALRVAGLKVLTLWGFGYQLSPADRKTAMHLILECAGVRPAT